ncbi:hypothetical protein [Fuerstiella marisgermanici]|uniref:Uncharacterized protein n=1 Tax=Fuerstiella marisgermanici TaxID=1891926 RepID=A0A1P8WQF2_9PLAN|nr:hypothetical protein [Fuerstiella marisgermanici]APZ96282.1 hypothetical protein Fuma_05950 [Fuerstiella marisgermanici]
MSSPHPENEFVTQEQLQASLWAQEHRLFALLQNGLTSRSLTESDPRRVAARNALMWRIVVSLAPGAAASGVGLVALFGLYFAWQANGLISDQNVLLTGQTEMLKSQTALLAKQNELVTVQSEIAESTRISGNTTQLATVLESIQVAIRDSKPSTESGLIKLDEDVAVRVAWITKLLRPYRYQRAFPTQFLNTFPTYNFSDSSVSAEWLRAEVEELLSKVVFLSE